MQILPLLLPAAAVAGRRCCLPLLLPAAAVAGRGCCRALLVPQRRSGGEKQQCAQAREGREYPYANA